MAYTLQAFIAKTATAQTLAEGYPHAAVISLNQDYALIPMTEDLYHELSQGEDRDLLEEFLRINAKIESLIKDLVDEGKLAYVESEFWAGMGTHQGIVWEGGKQILHVAPHSRGMNRILRELGVVRVEGKDEFDTLDLGRQRSVDDWMEEESE